MTDEEKDKIWLCMTRLGKAHDDLNYFLGGTGRDTDIRDALLEMQNHVRDALNVVMK